MVRKTALFLLVAANTAFACLNEYEYPEHKYELHEKEVAAGNSLRESITHNDLNAPWTAVRDQREARLKTAPTIETRNDYAVALCHTGDPNSAIEILLAIEKEKPGLYQTAANLGTAYELAGNNDDALQWIEEGIRRNPQSHEGSEWIHVAILKAKLAIATDPHWLATHDVLGLDFGQEPAPRTPPQLPLNNFGKPASLIEIRNGLRHQLHERIEFVHSPDLLVCQLLFDLGNLAVLMNGRNAGTSLYEFAAEYGQGASAGAAPTSVLTNRWTYARQVYPKPFYKRTASMLILGSLLILLVVLLIGRLVKMVFEV